MSYRFVIVGGIIAVAMCAPLAMADDRAAAQTFNEIFGDQLREVTRTRDKSDDMALARGLIDSAAQQQDVALKRYLLIQAYELARRDSSGDDMALEAADLFAAAFPDEKVKVMEMRLGVQETQYRLAGRDEREELAGAYLRALLELGEIQLQSEEPHEAIANFRKALPVAAAAGMPREVMAQIGDRAQMASKRHAALRRIEQLVQQVDAHPDDLAMREKLVNLLAVERNDLARAEELAAPLSNAVLKRHLHVLNQPDVAAEKDLSEAASWLMETASAEASPVGQSQAFAGAAKIYEQILKSNSEDAVMQLRLDAVNQKLAMLMPVDLGNASTAATTGTGTGTGASSGGITSSGGVKTVDLIQAMANGGKIFRRVEVAGDGMLLNDRSEAYFPIAPDSDRSFEFAMTFSAAGEGPHVGILLPIGGRLLGILCDYPKDGLLIFNMSKKQNTDVSFENNKTYDLLIRVRRQNQLVQVSILIDKQQVAEWTGEVGEIKPAYEDKSFNGFGVHVSGGTLGIRSATLKCKDVEKVKFE